MKRIVMLSIVTLLILQSCQSKSDKRSIAQNRNEAIKVGPDSNNIKDLIDVDEIDIKNDTLLIVSGSDFLYYPFGVYKNFKIFLQKYPFMSHKLDVVKDTTSDMMINISRFSFRKSFANFMYSGETGKLEITSSIIVDSEIKLRHDIFVGMSKSDFFRKINIETNSDQQSKVKIVKFESVVLGVFMIFRFEKDFLNEIITDTNYHLQLK